MSEEKKRPMGVRLIELQNGGTPFEVVLARLYQEEKTQARVADRLGIRQTQLRRYEAALGLRKEVVIRDRAGELVGSA